MRCLRPLIVAIAATAAAAAPAVAQRLFRSTAPVEVTFTTTLKQLIRERDSLKLSPHPAQMTYKDSAGKEVNVPVVLRARGHFRRQARNCDFPPIRWEAKRGDVNNTLFQGLTKMKLTTACRPTNSEYQQYILGEYAAYRMYQELSPLHFRTRLAKVTYKDSAGPKSSPDVTTWAFFIEDDAEMARQNKLKVLTQEGALFEDLDQKQLMTSMLFEYMIGNTDASIAKLHNVVVLRDATTQVLYPVMYDFDWGGLVNPRYAFPDAQLKIKRVTDRLHRGPCKPLAEWKPVFAQFLAKRAWVDTLYASIPEIMPSRVKESKSFLEDFWKTISDDRRAKYEIVEECQKQGM